MAAGSCAHGASRALGDAQRAELPDARPPAPRFAYYTLDSGVGLSVKEIAPDGGPADGGTVITVHGTGFVDHGGLLCLFETERDFEGHVRPTSATSHGVVPATWLDEQAVKCVAPPTTIEAYEGTDVHRLRRGNNRATLLGYAAVRAVEISINGDAAQATRESPADFIFYDASELRVSFLYPHGGPAQGGTAVTVRRAALDPAAPRPSSSLSPPCPPRPPICAGVGQRLW